MTTDGAGAQPHDERMQVGWYADLVEGTGQAATLPTALRDALAVATSDAAAEVQHRVVARRAAAAAAERERAEEARRQRERAEAQRQRDAEAARAQAAADGRARTRRRFWTVFVGGVITCVTVLVPWLIGTQTRDGAFRQQDPDVFETSVRDAGRYFSSDWAAGSGWVAIAVGVMLLLGAAYGRQVYGLSLGYVAVALLVVAAGPMLIGMSARAWSRAETASAYDLYTQPVPSDRMTCPGVGPADDVVDVGYGAFELNAGTGVAWRAQLRTLDPPDETGVPELGLCVYSGWNYAGTVSLGRIVLPTQGERWRLFTPVDGTRGMAVIVARPADSGQTWLYGAPLALDQPSEGGPLPAWSANTAVDGNESTELVTRGAAWAAVVPLADARVEAIGGPHLVLGPWLDDVVADVTAFDATGVATVVAAGVDNNAWAFNEGILYLIPGAAEDGPGWGTLPGTALVELGPDLAPVWQAPCPDGSGVWSLGYGGFSCGANGEYYADLTARQWVLDQ